MVASEQEKFREEIFERVKKILMNLLKIFREKKVESRPKLTWDTDVVNDLAVDSLESLDLMNAIEDEFQISPNPNEVNSKRKLSQIVDYIIELLNKKSVKR